jgi:hypothetical protein
VAAAEEVQVQVKDGLAGAAAVIEDGAIAREEIAFGGELRGDELQFPEKGLIAVMRVLERRKMLSWADQNVRGRLGIDVFEGENVIVFVDEFRGNLLRADFAEKAVCVHLPHS